MKRNPAANCGNCPYWRAGLVKHIGYCQYYPNSHTVIDLDWCGQHPDFWETVEITETIPTVWPNKYAEGTE